MKMRVVSTAELRMKVVIEFYELVQDGYGADFVRVDLQQQAVHIHQMQHTAEGMKNHET